MIKQVVKSEKELRKLIKLDLNSSSSNKHGKNSKEEIENVIEYFLEVNENIQYPCFIFADFTFTYRGLDVDLVLSSLILSKDELLEIVDTF